MLLLRKTLYYVSLPLQYEHHSKQTPFQYGHLTTTDISTIRRFSGSATLIRTQLEYEYLSNTDISLHSSSCNKSTDILQQICSRKADNRELKQATFLSTRTSAGSKSRRYRWRVMASAVLV